MTSGLGKICMDNILQKWWLSGALGYRVSFEHLNRRQVVYFLPHFQLLLSSESPIFGEGRVFVALLNSPMKL